MNNTYELYHYGIKGMKWGVRRYQNKDGSLTDEGRKRLVKSIRKTARTWYGNRNMGVLTNKLKDEFERESSLNDTAKKLRKLKDEYDELEKAAWKISDKKERSVALKKSDEAFIRYERERDKVVDSLLGKYGDTVIPTSYGNIQLLTTGKNLTSEALNKLAGWHYITKNDMKRGV